MFESVSTVILWIWLKSEEVAFTADHVYCGNVNTWQPSASGLFRPLPILGISGSQDINLVISLNFTCCGLFFFYYFYIKSWNWGKIRIRIRKSGLFKKVMINSTKYNNTSWSFNLWQNSKVNFYNMAYELLESQ